MNVVLSVDFTAGLRPCEVFELFHLIMSLKKKKYIKSFAATTGEKVTSLVSEMGTLCREPHSQLDASLKSMSMTNL